MMITIIIAVIALIAYSMVRASAQADAQEAKFWAERVENSKDDRTLVRDEKRVKNENTAPSGGGDEHDHKKRSSEHTGKA